MKDTRLNGYVYDFSLDYGAFAVDDIKDIINLGCWGELGLTQKELLKYLESFSILVSEGSLSIKIAL